MACCWRHLALMDLPGVKGMLLGDKGFIRPILKEALASQGIDLATRRCAAIC
ncbi:hypothetical protein [Polaromonas sp.]|uniref:hypothetical protein n=1 Tax=Polaromonas sp. TaxID=1869339 RepID=UPI003BB58EA0